MPQNGRCTPPLAPEHATEVPLNLQPALLHRVWGWRGVGERSRQRDRGSLGVCLARARCTALAQIGLRYLGQFWDIWAIWHKDPSKLRPLGRDQGSKSGKRPSESFTSFMLLKLGKNTLENRPQWVCSPSTWHKMTLFMMPKSTN